LGHRRSPFFKNYEVAPAPAPDARDVPPVAVSAIKIGPSQTQLKQPEAHTVVQATRHNQKPAG